MHLTPQAILLASLLHLLMLAGIAIVAAFPLVLLDRTLRARRGLPPRDWLYVDDPHAAETPSTSKERT